MQQSSSRWIQSVGEDADAGLDSVARIQDAWPWLHALLDDVHAGQAGAAGVDGATLLLAQDAHTSATLRGCNSTSGGTAAVGSRCDAYNRLYGVDRSTSLPVPSGSAVDAFTRSHSADGAVVMGFNRVVQGLLIKQRRRGSGRCHAVDFEHRLPWCASDGEEDTSAFRGKHQSGIQTNDRGRRGHYNNKNAVVSHCLSTLFKAFFSSFKIHVFVSIQGRTPAGHTVTWRPTRCCRVAEAS